MYCRVDGSRCYSRPLLPGDRFLQASPLTDSEAELTPSLIAMARLATAQLPSNHRACLSRSGEFGEMPLSTIQPASCQFSFEPARVFKSQTAHRAQPSAPAPPVLIASGVVSLPKADSSTTIRRGADRLRRRPKRRNSGQPRSAKELLAAFRAATASLFGYSASCLRMHRLSLEAPRSLTSWRKRGDGSRGTPDDHANWICSYEHVERSHEGTGTRS
jgi:hypothetical protein